MDSSKFTDFEMENSETMPIQKREDIMKAIETKKNPIEDVETSNTQGETDFGKAIPGSSVDKTEQSSIEKINETLLKFSESGGQSTPIVVELGQQLQDLRDLIDVKTDPTLLKYCAAAFPGEDRKTFIQAVLVSRVIDLTHMTLFRFLPVKKVHQLVTLAGEEQVVKLLESRGINAASNTNGKNGIQTFKFQIDRLLDSLKSQRAAAAPKKNGIIVLGTSLERFADKSEKALCDNVAIVFII